MADVVIRKQKIRVEVADESLAFDCRKFVNERLNDELLKMYERIFHQRSVSQDYVIIDSLKIDLGIVSVNDFYDHIIELIEQKLTGELRKQFEVISENFKTEHNHTPLSPISFATERQQNEDAILYFFENGNYPWWYKKSEREKPSKFLTTLDRSEEEKLLLKIITKVRSLPENNAERFLKRFVDHLEPDFCEDYIRKVAGLYSNSSFQLNLSVLLNKKEQFVQVFNIQLKVFYEQVLCFILLSHSDKHFFATFFKRLLAVSHSTMDEVRSRATKANIDHVFFDTSDVTTTESGGGKSYYDSFPEKTASKEKTAFSSIIHEDGIYIENSGLILLNPFLTAYFKGLSLLDDDDQFHSEEARNRAAVLLYYLQGCSQEYNEWEMTLNKVLCGMPVNDVIAMDTRLSAYEMEESRILLQTVVDYWDALKGSSIAAMQNTFIMREGKLTYKDNYWLMQVERSGVDILLERLPWGISTIKLPWLQDLIYTEW